MFQIAKHRICQISARRSLFARNLAASCILAKQKSATSSVLSPDYKFKCGLEIHCQLKTTNKLFSNSDHVFNESPNTRVSYFDAGLPGSQPLLNRKALLLTLIAGIALNSNVSEVSTFDRKHYFYGDQPLGYQITQHYNPIFKGGHLKLLKRFDEIDEAEKVITLDQIQIEQDTGKSIHVDEGISALLNGASHAKIDLNRANVPLIEVVTNPDFENLKQIKAFIKKFQSLVKFLNISTGDLETGAMRVDVNVSINGGNRVEIKNLSSSSAILGAIKYEYKRQVEELEAGSTITQETRGWDGAKTTKLRRKETSIDYRYMPDPELPPVKIKDTLLQKVKEHHVKALPDDIISKLVSKPYQLRVKDAKLLVNDVYPGLINYYLNVFEQTVTKYGADRIPNKIPGNFILHELVGQLGKYNLPFSNSFLPEGKLVELITAIYIDKRVTNSSGKLLLSYIIENHTNKEIQNSSVGSLIEAFELETPAELSQDLHREIEELCDGIMEQFPDIVQNLKAGKKLNSLQYLIGQAMRATQGKIQPSVFEVQFKQKIGL